MKYRAIKDHAGRYRVSLMCRALQVSQSGYYAWLKRPVSERKQRNAQLLGEIQQIYQRSRCTYGSPRVWHALKGTHGVGRHRVARLMQQHGLRAITHHRSYAKYSRTHGEPIAPNRLNRQFEVSAPNRCWVGDITYLWSPEGWVHLAVVIDLYSRAVIGWSMSSRMDTQLVIAALRMAITHRQAGPGVVFHSDQGVQYASADYQRELRHHGIECSMSRLGNCWDNAVAESFFASLKKEIIHNKRYADRVQLENAVFDWIEIFYNRQRQHSTLGYRSPAQFEAEALT